MIYKIIGKGRMDRIELLLVFLFMALLVYPLEKKISTSEWTRLSIMHFFLIARDHDEWQALFEISAMLYLEFFFFFFFFSFLLLSFILILILVCLSVSSVCLFVCICFVCICIVTATMTSADSMQALNSTSIESKLTSSSISIPEVHNH